VTSPPAPAKKGRRPWGCVLGALAVAVIAAIGISSLLRAKLSALESATLDDLRTMVAAQAAYSERNGGFYEPRLECLAEPASCLPDYPRDGRPFLEPVLASLQDKTGYRRAFHPGPPASPPPAGQARSRPPGIVSFAYTAVPYAYEGMKAFCGDSTGALCFRRDGREPGITPEGRCDLSTCDRYE
jgi:hypothetical protein